MYVQDGHKNVIGDCCLNLSDGCDGRSSADLAKTHRLARASPQHHGGMMGGLGSQG